MSTDSDRLDPVVLACIEQLSRRPGRLFDAAERQRLAPLLYYWFLRHGYPHSVSEAEREQFRRAYYTSAGRNVELLSALSEVSSALDQRDIACVAFKGADLARSLYPNVGVRPMGDLDIYVSPKDAERAEEVLGASGYRPWSPDMTPGLSRRIRHARLYVGGAHQAVSVDLHWSLVGHSEDARAPERDWIDRHTLRSGASWQRLSESAHLLYLAAHMKLQHYDEEIPLLWLVDFYRLATAIHIADNADDNWDELLRDAARFGWSDALAATAFDVREQLRVTLPPALERLAASFGGAPRLHRRGARHEPERVWNELRTLPWSGRLALLRAYVLPSPSYVRYRYPPAFLPEWTWPVGYVKRWGQMALKAASLAVRALTRRDRSVPLLASRESC